MTPLQTIDLLLSLIGKEQSKTDESSKYTSGHFPAYRYHKKLPIERQDNNAFFAASVSYILNDCRYRLSAKHSDLVGTISSKTNKSFESYHHHERNSYNFWPQGANNHFPNGVFMHRSSHFKLPDDIDTSSMILLAQGANHEDSQALHDLLPAHANNVNLTVKTSLDKWSNSPVYSSWLGEKMPIEIDLCVLSNAMLLFETAQVDKNEHDEATLSLIKDAIESQDWSHHTYVTAPSYPSKAVILYHIGRLFYAQKIDDPQFKESVLAEYNSTHDQWSKLLLSTTLHRENIDHAPPTHLPEIDIDWFTAGFLSVFAHPFAKKLAPSPWFQYQFRCRALSLSLMVEHQSFLLKP